MRGIYALFEIERVICGKSGSLTVALNSTTTKMNAFVLHFQRCKYCCRKLWTNNHWAEGLRSLVAAQTAIRQRSLKLCDHIEPGHINDPQDTIDRTFTVMDQYDL